VSWLGLALLLAACTAGGGAGNAPVVRQVSAPLEPVRVLYGETTPALLPYWAAMQEGYFGKNGLQVALIPERDPQAAFARLVAGEADVYLTPLSPALVGQVAEGADLVVLGGSPTLAIVTTQRFLGAREFILERFLRGLLEGVHAVGTRPALARDLLASGAGLTARDQVDAALDLYLTRSPGPVPYLENEDVEQIIEQRVAVDPRAAQVDRDRLLSQTLLRRLEASGYVASLYRA
jgi:ABC-type nitrate/sulfonate/bicarbonate transport system substrate-binding protein